MTPTPIPEGPVFGPHRATVQPPYRPGRPAVTACFSCVVDAKREAGIPTTPEELRHWSLWGCTCDERDAEEAMAWMDLVTR